MVITKARKYHMSKMADADERDENVDSMETDSASEGKSESPPKRPDNLCCYSQKECDLEKLKGFDFCHKHILEDSASPFKPCDFISKTNGKKCTNPAPKLPGGQKTYCLIHTRDSELRKALEAKTKKKKRKLSGQQEEQAKPLTPKQGPGRPPGVRNYTKRPKIIDLATEYRRDDVLRVESSWHGDYESDSESLDNDMDDPLRHAGVWSSEEVTKICRDKLLRLRSLYMSQFERLKHVYKNKRRKFLLATSANEEGLTACAKEPEPNEPLSSLHIASRCYNKRYRTDALLQKQSKEKRLGPATRNQTLPHQRCTHYTEGNRCTSKIVPLAKFCLKHICHDQNQQLFLPCSQLIGADQSCGVAVPNISNHEKCILHLPHSNDLSVGDLEQELREAKERQLIKEKETEDRRKAALAQAAHEARLSEIAVAEAITAQQTQKPTEDIKTPMEFQATLKTKQGSSTAPNTQQNETPATTKLPPKFSECSRTNHQIETQAEKITVSNVASPALPPTVSASKQSESKVGYPVNSSNTNVKDTPPETACQPQNVNTVSTFSNAQIKPTDTLASPLSVKLCTSTNSSATAADLTQAKSLDNPLKVTEERNSVLPASKPVISADTSVQGSQPTGNTPTNPEITKSNKKSSTSEMDVGI